MAACLEDSLVKGIMHHDAGMRPPQLILDNDHASEPSLISEATNEDQPSTITNEKEQPQVEQPLVEKQRPDYSEEKNSQVSSDRTDSARS